MTDTPKQWKDMTDAEKGALLLAHHEGKAIENLGPMEARWITAKPHWAGDFAYRIAPPKFLPLEAGKVYRTANCDRECILVRDGRAWLIHGNGIGYTWNAETGESICLGDEHQIIGLSDNQEPSQ